MTDAFLEELRTLLGAGFTGTVTLHIDQSCVKQYEVLERRRPKPDDGLVDLSEGKGDGVDSGTPTTRGS